jgi:transcriptional regulator with XRE-family HTH domain
VSRRLELASGGVQRRGGGRSLTGPYAIAYTVVVAGDERGRVAGDLLRLARVKAGLTQAVLAERAGVAQTLISAYENGRRQPTLPTLMRLLEAAGFELRMRLEAPDIQARAVEEWAASRPVGERRRWAREQAALRSRR